MDNEIEIKLKIVDLEETHQKIRNIGFLQINDFQFEDNFLYDFDDLSLKERGTILRIREYAKRCMLTLKEKVQKAQDDPLYKVRSEVEVQFHNAENLKKIFALLGLRVTYRYQKYRAEFKMGDLSIFVDRTPVGNFIELEGRREDIDKGASLLGYTKDDYINISYRTYHRDHLKERGLPPSDLLFDTIEQQESH